MANSTKKSLSVEWRFNFDREIKNNFSNRQWSARVKDEVVDKMILPEIAKGNSPVSGGRRFERYSESYVAEIKSHKGSGKNTRPVNLYMTGEMLGYYNSRPSSDQTSIEIGIFKEEAPKDVLVRAGALNSGTKNMPARPFIPIRGQEFIGKIALEIRKIFGEVLNQAINKRRTK